MSIRSDTDFAMVHAMELLERKSDSPAGGKYGVVSVGHDALIFQFALVIHHVHSVIRLQKWVPANMPKGRRCRSERPNLSLSRVSTPGIV